MQDRVAIITGGGTGIGRATAIRFARAGAWVAIVGRRSAPLEETARESDRIVPMSADILQPSELDGVVDGVHGRWGRIDVLVNNAGTFMERALEDIDPEVVTSLFATNVLGPSLLSQAVLPGLKATQGSIVNVSSTFGHKAAPLISHYGASKAALEHLTRCWALELAPHRVRVNAVAPGPTETDILARSGLPAAAIEQIQKEESQRVPLGRRGTTDDVARWIMHLADSEASWMTGQVIAVDGGLSVA